jgi:hypothetical protein
MGLTPRAGTSMVVLFFFILSGFVSAVQPASREYQVKAVFLYNFAQFVEWPEDAFTSNHSPLVIGVLGENPFGEYLNEAVQGEVLNGHPLKVQQYEKVEEVVNCHILYVNQNKKEALGRTLNALQSKSILTVGDAGNFIEQGGMVRFFTEKGKTRIQIDLESTKKADIVVSSKLLRVADVVGAELN